MDRPVRPRRPAAPAVRPRVAATALGHCECGAPVDSAAFRDRLSYREWFVSGLCQCCQDLVFLARCPESGRALPLRRGALVACRSGELAALPFVYAGRFGARAWDARDAIRVGPDVVDSDPRLAFAPMRAQLREHQLRVYTARTWWRGVAHRLGPLDFVLTLDATMIGRLRAAAPPLRAVPAVALADADGAACAFGLDPGALVAAVHAPDWPVSDLSPPTALAICARLAAVLEAAVLPGARTRAAVAFDALLAAYAPFGPGPSPL